MVVEKRKRLIKISSNNNLLLVGPRGSGKSTLIREIFAKQKCLWIDLLADEDEERFGHNPDELSHFLKASPDISFVIIDEVQKFPKLLDIVHKQIEAPNNQIKFILSGSSARKLKRGHANLTAGRLFLRELAPFSFLELEDDFHLNECLNWGMLPKIFELDNEEDKFLFLRSYCKAYIKEEVLLEQLVRKVEAFRDFLPIAAQNNGKIINFSRISKEVGINDNSTKNYYQILEDTLIGFFLPSFHRSIRKRQRQSPKFYFFDTGVKKALDGTSKVKLEKRTSEYGHAFEHFIILECIKLNEIYLCDFKFSYYLTKDGVEIDLIIERPGMSDLLVEIKSTEKVHDQMVTSLQKTSKAWDKESIPQIWSNDPLRKEIGGVICLPWKEGLQETFLVGR
jgi:uncharacterized protein